MVQDSVRAWLDFYPPPGLSQPESGIPEVELRPLLLRRKAENEHSDRGGPQQGTSASCHQQNAVCSCPE